MSRTVHLSVMLLHGWSLRGNLPDFTPRLGERQSTAFDGKAPILHVAV